MLPFCCACQEVRTGQRCGGDCGGLRIICCKKMVKVIPLLSPGAGGTNSQLRPVFGNGPAGDLHPIHGEEIA